MLIFPLVYVEHFLIHYKENREVRRFSGVSHI